MRLASTSPSRTHAIAARQGSSAAVKPRMAADRWVIERLDVEPGAGLVGLLEGALRIDDTGHRSSIAPVMALASLTGDQLPSPITSQGRPPSRRPRRLVWP